MSGTDRHVAIVGAGSVGSSVAYACLLQGVASRITLHDHDEARVRAEVLDLDHGIQFAPQARVTGGSDIGVCAGAHVVVLTAGAKQRPGQSRLDLAAANASLGAELVPRVLDVAPEAVVLVVTNPVDVVTQVATRAARLPAGRVFGSGTVLDSSRLRFLLGEHCGVAVQNVHAYVVGEHGDSELALWSSATIGGVPLVDWSVPGHGDLTAPTRARIMESVRDAAQEIIAGKGATNWAIGLATARILRAVLGDERRVLPVSAPLGGFAGLPDVCLSLPRVVGRDGTGAVLPTPLAGDEHAALLASARTIERAVAAVGG